MASSTHFTVDRTRLDRPTNTVDFEPPPFDRKYWLQEYRQLALAALCDPDNAIFDEKEYDDGV